VTEHEADTPPRRRGAGRGTRALVRAVAELAATHHAEISQRMFARIAGEIDAMTTDRPTRDALERAAADGVTAVTEFLRDDRPEIEIPAASFALVRTLARQGFPISTVDRSNRLAQDSILRWCLEVLAGLSDDAEAVMQAGVVILTKLSTGIDGVSLRLLAVYEAERDTWLSNRNVSRSTRIQDILAGRPVEVGEAEATLGYRLGQRHLGVIVWTEEIDTTRNDLSELEQAVTALADELGAPARPLFEPHDAHTGWAWIPLGGVETVDTDALGDVVAGWDRTVTVALGAPQDGIGGFVHTHEQAEHAQVVARAAGAAGPRLVPITAVGAVALMCADLDAARTWVADVLGPLAAHDPAAGQLRHTLREFLANGGSYVATASRLHLHRNSVAYRINKAEEQLGRSVREGRLDLENALALCHWLGSAVLTPVAEVPAPPV